MRLYTKIAVTIIMLSINFSHIYALGYNKTAEEYDKIIKSMYRENSMDSIKIILDEALKLYPNDTDLNRWAGTYFLQKKEIDNARYFLIKAIQQDSENYLAKQQMVALEEGEGNISSAICYVNEMLEQYPYDQALWKKKIGLYRKQGNDTEADRLLNRLYTIYPNDSTVRNDYINRLEEIYINKRKEGKKDEAVSTLKKLIGYKNNEKTYYLALANLLLQQGHSEEAAATLSQGLEHFPADSELLKKKAEIMAERGYSKDAVGLLRKSDSKDLYPVADEIMIEAARSENWKDPYILYGRIYESKKSKEALDYLIRISMQREYYDDALYYLSENRKRYGNSAEILYKEYTVLKRTGNRKAALKTLEKYVSLNSTDKDMSDELALLKTDVADEYINNNISEEAIPYLESALNYSNDNEIKTSIINKLLYCYQNTNKNEKAILLIDSVRASENNNLIYAEQKAKVLHKIGKSDVAISELEQTGNINSETYEDISLDYVKRLTTVGAEKKHMQ
ncbi:MAG: tetratricopeptide repeat protein [Candidatus Phocaeicola faecipullorum]|nr:tetratricopeptide repeat protein [Candidatus Phocaeicola faecipullorum]